MEEAVERQGGRERENLKNEGKKKSKKSHFLSTLSFSLFLSFSISTMAAEAVVKEKKRKRSSSSKNKSANDTGKKKKRDEAWFFY